MTKKRISILLVTAVLFLLPLVSTGCSAGSGAEADHTFSIAPLHAMPEDVQKSPVTVQQSYQFAAANQEFLQQLPCYCGCGAAGHTSNYACYFSNTGELSALTYDAHALGCSICVDITQDAMRMLDQGKDLAEIRTEIDTTYSQYGPSNIP